MSERLNVGDVTGPRWAGGTRNPSSIDSGNAEKAWRAWRDDHPSGVYNVPYVAFMAGRASRDAEVEVLREQLAAAEAVIEKAPHVDCATQWDGPEHSDTCNCWKSKTRLAILAAVKADAWDEGAAANWDGQDLRHPNPYRTGDIDA